MEPELPLDNIDMLRGLVIVIMALAPGLVAQLRLAVATRLPDNAAWNR